MKNRFISGVLVAAAIFPAVLGAQNYFVDGFHGGVYGHYPLQTYTGYMCDLLDAHPDLRIGLEIEPETWDSVKVVAPLDYARLQAYLKSGDRAEYTNPSYAQPYFYNICGESVIRQLEYGIQKLEEHFPGISISTYACEEPCFTSALPTVLSAFGFKYAVLKNPNTCWGGYCASAPGGIVDWTGPDGTSLRSVPRYVSETLGNDVWTTTANGLVAGYWDAASAAGVAHPVAMCYQDAGWTRGPWLPDKFKAEGRVSNVGWTEYFTTVADKDPAVPYRMSQDDVRSSLMWGSQVMQRIALSVRHAENSMLAAEKLGTMANIADGYAYDRSVMDEGWRCLLLSQHHDSWIVPYNGLKGRGTWADWICSRWTPDAERAAAETIAQAGESLSVPGGAPVLRVFNTLPYARHEVVETAIPNCPDGMEPVISGSDGEMVASGFSEGTLSFVADVPAFGYADYFICFGPAKPEARPVSDPAVMENDLYRICFDPARGGVISSIILKGQGGRELVRPDGGFARLGGFFYDEGVYHASTDAPATVEKLQDGPFVHVMRISGLIGSHPFTQTVTLRQGDPKILFDLQIDWKGSPGIGTYRQKDAYNNPRRSFYDESGHLNVFFPTWADGGALFKNAPFDVCRSVNDSTRYDDWREIRHNVILNWVDLQKEGEGSVALLSDRTTSYVCTPGTPLGLTVQYSGNGLWGRDYRIDGPTSLQYAILPHQGGWQDAEKSDREWNEPLKCVLTTAGAVASRSFLSVSDPGYELSSAQISKDGGVLIRLFNSHGGDSVDVLLDGDFRYALETDLRGNVLRRHPLRTRGGRKVLHAQMHQFAIKTFILR